MNEEKEEEDRTRDTRAAFFFARRPVGAVYTGLRWVLFREPAFARYGGERRGTTGGKLRILLIPDSNLSLSSIPLCPTQLAKGESVWKSFWAGGRRGRGY